MPVVEGGRRRSKTVEGGARPPRRYFLILGLLLLATCRSSGGPATLISNVTILDGSGGAPYVSSVRIEGDRIVAVGDEAAKDGDVWFIDGTGLALAPGFIDSHSHADGDLREHRDAIAAVSQGITTVVVGQDGGSPFPLKDFFQQLDSTPAAVNVAAYSGHNTLRAQVMGEDFRREATQVEIDSMKALLLADFDAGALGLSSGLEYDPGIFSSRKEVLDLAAAVGPEGGRYISHIRSEDRAFWDAIDEIITVGREAALPVQISHLKLAMRGLWGRADSLIALLDAARSRGIDITADIYPYTYWQSTLTVMFPERNFSDRAAAEFALREVAAPEGLLLGRYAPDPSYAGKTVAQIAALRGRDPAGTLMSLIADAEAYRARTPDAGDVESVIGTSMDEADVERLLAWPFASISTDGELAGRHPRGYGAFARVLGVYARERRVFGMAEAVRKMTALPAHNLGLLDRGVIRQGAAADLVLFDTLVVRDNATTDNPHGPASGISMVWVNGEVVYEKGAATGKFPGRGLRRANARSE
jgi:N-acyl-D-amino-acid deacylase